MRLADQNAYAGFCGDLFNSEKLRHLPVVTLEMLKTRKLLPEAVIPSKSEARLELVNQLPPAMVLELIYRFQFA